MSIRIDKEFESLIPPLSAEEFQQLEENCLRDGIRDALIVWEQDGNDILIDGHNRFRIVGKHPTIQFNIKRMQFADRDAVIEWICNNQLGRRNLHVLDRESLMNKKREVLARKAKQRMSDGGKGKEIFPDLKTQTRDIIGKELGVSGRQVDKLHAINEKATPRTKQLVREGKLSINQAYNSVHEKRPDPVKQAKKEHEDFKERKQDSVVSIQDAQIDKINQGIIEKDLYQKVLKLIGDIEAFGMLNKKAELQAMFASLDRDERERIRKKCTMCIMTLQIISESTWR